MKGVCGAQGVLEVVTEGRVRVRWSVPLIALLRECGREKEVEEEDEERRW